VGQLDRAGSLVESRRISRCTTLEQHLGIQVVRPRRLISLRLDSCSPPERRVTATAARSFAT